MDSAATRAQALLDVLRQTAMRRGAISKRQSRLQADIAGTIEGQGVPTALARRIAFQLVIKFVAAEPADRARYGARLAG